MVVLRFGGLPSDALLSCGETMAALSRLRQLELNGRGTRAACDAIEALLPDIYSADRPAAGAALRVKRDLHNARRPRPGDLRLMRPFMSAANGDRIEGVLRRHSAIARARSELSATHATEIEGEFVKAVELLNGADIARGLANTNPDLAIRVRQAAAAPEKLKAKVLASTQVSALRQVGRVALKTSPLNVFGVVALGSWGDEGRPLAEGLSLDAPFAIRSVPSFANLDYLTATLCAEPSLMADTLPLRLNGSLRLESGNFTWRKVESSPIEWRVRHTQVTRSDSTSVPLRVLAKLVGAELISRGELRTSLKALLPHENDERVEALITSAIQAQFLVIDGLFAVHPREAAERIVAHVHSPMRERIVEALAALDANACERRADLATATTLELLSHIGASPSAAEIRPAIYEDAVVAGESFRFAAKDVLELADELAVAVRLASELQPNTLLERTRRFLVKTFTDLHGPGGLATDAFRFLSDCSDQMERFISGGPDEPSEMLADESEVKRVVDRFLGMGDGDHVRLTRETVADALKRPVPRTTSQICFIQPYRGVDGNRRFALNRCYAGGASTFSRFLPRAGSQVAALRDYIVELSEEGGPVEIVGWFGFNACDRPDLVERKVAIPPLDSPADNLPDLRRYGLRHRPEWDDLVFVDPQGRDVSLTFSSVLAVSMMPRVHSFARMIGTHTESYAEAWRPFLKHGRRDPDGRLRLPRIDVGPLTIVRRQVLIDASHLPLDKGGLEFYVSFNEIMDAERMPRFLYACRLDSASTPSVASRRWKPQFVDRHGPAFVASLRKELAQHDGDVQFVEALPEPHDVFLRRDGRPVFAELGIEVAQCHR